MQLHDIIGYIGAGFLFSRFLPVIYQQLYNPTKINYIFLSLEALSCIFLGSAAIMIRSYPFIISNAFSFICVISICIIRFYKFKRNNIVADTIIN